MAAANTKICPDCGAENDANDLFCKDCGTSIAMVTAGSQHTAAFTPVDTGAETQTTTIAPAPPPPSTYTGGFASVPAEQSPAYTYTPPPESIRGAVLGWIAATIILIILAAYLWSSVISDSARDSITGIF